MKTLISIDPGAKGAIAVRYAGGAVQTSSLDATDRDNCDELRDIRDSAATGELFCWLENVGGYRPGNSGPASVKFARGIGKLEGMLIALDIPFDRVAPQTWMKALGVLPKDKAERKQAIKAKIQERYPELKVTLQNADALGILTWALQQERGS
jgi:hypothetical protein